jgi:uncharacterized repeat protein (TIGR03843 family)
MPRQSTRDIIIILTQGKITLQGQFRYGSNYTFLVSVEQDGVAVPAVYKPMRGEQTLWDFPEASLARRERTAYLVSEALGLGMVPFTIIRDGPHGPGSLQEFIDHNPNLHYFTFPQSVREQLRPVAVFDLLVNNADRKGGHILLQKRTRRLYLIDHGLCFHAEDKLRTVIWDFAGQEFPPELIARLMDFQGRFSSWTSACMVNLLEPDELEALETRLAGLVHNPVFPPPPDDRRAFPFPPV